MSILPLSTAHRHAAIELQTTLLRFEEAALAAIEQIYEEGVSRERRVFERLEQRGNAAATAAAQGPAGGMDTNMALMKSYMELAALALEGKVRGRARLELSQGKWRSSLLGALNVKAR